MAEIRFSSRLAFKHLYQLNIIKALLILLIMTTAGLCLLLNRTKRESLVIPQNQTFAEALPHGKHRVSELFAMPLAVNAPARLPDNEILGLMQQIKTALKRGNSEDHDLVFTNLLLDLIKMDPCSAARLAESLDVGAGRDEMLRRVAQHWAEQDPATAQHWAEQLADEGERHLAETAICLQIAQTDARQAIQMATQYGLDNTSGATLENLVQQWAGQDMTTAIGWVKERPAGEQKDQMFYRLAMVLTKTSPAEAAQMVVDQISAGATQNEAAISVVHQWAENDMAGARAWVELFPESPLRTRALNELNGLQAGQN
jgi:DNA-binding transcriptional regulator YbjK